ncbi:hypothetical protein NL676_031156 [Syzygium grande]|nr:hypothetical protein NL676_031156 [Syzygium grande]
MRCRGRVSGKLPVGSRGAWQEEPCTCRMKRIVSTFSDTKPDGGQDVPPTNFIGSAECRSFHTNPKTPECTSGEVSQAPKCIGVGPSSARSNHEPNPRAAVLCARSILPHRRRSPAMTPPGPPLSCLITAANGHTFKP